MVAYWRLPRFRRDVSHGSMRLTEADKLHIELINNTNVINRTICALYNMQQ